MKKSVECWSSLKWSQKLPCENHIWAELQRVGGRYREARKQWEKESQPTVRKDARRAFEAPNRLGVSDALSPLLGWVCVCRLRARKWQSAGGAQRRMWFRVFLTLCGPAARRVSARCQFLAPSKHEECISERPGQDGAGAAALHPNFTPSVEKWATFAQTQPQTLSLLILPRGPPFAQLSEFGLGLLKGAFREAEMWGPLSQHGPKEDETPSVFKQPPDEQRTGKGLLKLVCKHTHRNSETVFQVCNLSFDPVLYF